MNYRPPDWDKLKAEIFGDVAIHTAHEDFLVEAGADAMLEAIWKLAKNSPTGTFTFDTNTINIFEEKE